MGAPSLAAHAMDRRTSQWVLLAGALILWSLFPVPIFAGPVLAYLAVWTLAARWDLSVSPRATALAMIVGSAAFAGAVIMHEDEIANSEQLPDLDVILRDRWRAAELPAIAPPVVRADRPETHYLFLPGAGSVTARFAGSDRDVALLELGHGLFRADLDPRRDGPISDTLLIDADGELTRRHVDVVRPSVHPRQLSSRPELGIAAAVSNETDEVILLRRAGAPERIPAGDRPTDCAIVDAGRIVVVHESGLVTRLGSDDRIDLGAPLVHVARGATDLAVTRAEPRPAIVLVSPDLQVEREIPLPFPPDRIAFGRDGELLVTSAVTRTLYLIRGDAVAARRFFGRPVVTMAASPDGERLFAAITDYRPDDDAGPNHHVEDQIVEIDTGTLRIIRRVPTAPHASPFAIEVEPERITIAFVGTDEVIRFDPSAFGARERIPIDRPTGVGALGEDALVVASSPNGRIERLAPSGRDGFSFSERGLIADGERAFYQATRAGLSCQTCHLEGGTDFSLHDIGQDGDPRPTLPLGGVARTAPYFRGASYPSIAKIEAFTTSVLGGYEAPIPERARALDAFVSSLPRPPSHPRPDPGALRRGTDAFVKAGCSFCHRFPAFTDLAQYPEGFLFPGRKDELHLLDTPSLIGVADRAPYLYDGRARTLEAVLIDENRARRHGDAPGLTEGERADLLIFLRSL